MEQYANQAGTVSLWKVLTLFVKKIKAIVIFTLIAAILGGALGAALTIMNESYGFEMVIKVSPVSESDDLLYALSSGYFSEKLILDENGLPPKALCNPTDYAAAEKALADYAAAREDAKEKSKASNTYYISDIENKYLALQNEYNQVFSLLKIYKDAQTEGTIDEAHKTMIALYEEKLLVAEKARNDYYNDYYSVAKEKETALQLEAKRALDKVRELNDEAEEALEKLMMVYRERPEVKELIKTLNNGVTYSHIRITEEVEVSKEGEEELNRKFIKINIDVADKRDVAEHILDCYKLRIEDCIEQYTEDTLGVVKSDCVIVNPSVSVERTSDSLSSGIVKYAAVTAVLGALITYCYFVLQYLAQENARKEAIVAEQLKAEKEAE